MTETDIAVPNGFEPFQETGTFISHIGPIYWRPLERSAEFWFRALPHQVNPMGIVHGGMLGTVADICLGCTAGVVLGHRGVYPTVSLNLSYVSAARLGDVIVGRAEVARITRTLAFVSGQLSVGDQPVLLATGVYRNPPPPKT